jgi:hypothetical protein
MALVSIPIPEEALLLRDRETYVIVVVRGKVEVFSAAGVYYVTKDNSIIDTIIYFDELKGKALNERYPRIKEVFVYRPIPEHGIAPPRGWAPGHAGLLRRQRPQLSA